MFALKVFILFSVFHPQLGVLSSRTEPDQDFSYMQYVQNAEVKPTREEYDYIIIGGGTAGCPLAATLSSSNYSVLLLERGNDPKAFPYLLSAQGMLNPFKDNDNGSSPFQRFVSEDGVENLRGRVLGGSSMINFGFYSRGHQEFFNKSGVDWDMEMVEKAYQWVEEAVVSQPNLSPNWQSTFREALLEAHVVPDNGYNLNNLVGTKTGGSIFDSNGIRHGAVELLNQANPKNLHVVIQATVTRILFSTSDGLSAIAVSYSDSKGKSHIAGIHEKGEIILSAGAIGSPQLLFLSGVGPKSHLSSLKLPVVHDQPHVGQFMHDNPRYGINLWLPFLSEPAVLQVVGTLENNIYIESLSTVLPLSFPRLFSVIPPQYSPVNLTLALISGKFSDVVSFGSLRLASSYDVGKNPIVRFNYYKDSRDVAKCVRGLRKIGDILNTPVMNEIKTRDLKGNKGFKFIGNSLPENMLDDGAVGEYCRQTVMTYWHYHGGCLVGKVVDGNFRVFGIKNLRVVDGSTFVESPGTNPMATVMMLGRYVGLKMLQQR